MTTGEQILSITPPGRAEDYALIIGSGVDIALLLRTRLGYGHVRVCGLSANAKGMEADSFDLERDFYPYPSAHFKTILCVDALDALSHDPMHMLDQIHRILRPGCHLVWSTQRFTGDQARALLENCGLEVGHWESGEDGTRAVGRKIGPLRERYPEWLYPKSR